MQTCGQAIATLRYLAVSSMGDGKSPSTSAGTGSYCYMTHRELLTATIECVLALSLALPYSSGHLLSHQKSHCLRLHDSHSKRRQIFISNFLQTTTLYLNHPSCTIIMMCHASNWNSNIWNFAREQLSRPILSFGEGVRRLRTHALEISARITARRASKPFIAL